MSDEIEPESMDDRIYFDAISIPPRITPEYREEWYTALNRFHVHFYPRATQEYRDAFAEIRKAIVSTLDLLVKDPDEFDFQMFEIMNRWAIECSKLYDDLGLKFRSERRHGLKHEEVEP